MLISIHDVIKRGWWDWYKCEIYLEPAKSIGGTNHYYQLIDIKLVELLFSYGLLKKEPQKKKFRMFKWVPGDVFTNMPELLHINLKSDLNLNNIRKKTKKYLNKLRIKTNKDLLSTNYAINNDEAIVAFMRHRYTNYDYILEVIKDLDLDSFEKTNLVKIIRMKVNFFIKMKYRGLKT